MRQPKISAKTNDDILPSTNARRFRFGETARYTLTRFLTTEIGHGSRRQDSQVRNTIISRAVDPHVSGMWRHRVREARAGGHRNDRDRVLDVRVVSAVVARSEAAHAEGRCYEVVSGGGAP